MKVFISHQRADSGVAAMIAARLDHHRVGYYLDVLDPGLARGEDIAAHVRDSLDRCDQLLAVVSESTKASWWVPWEIGLATEKDYPLATYASGVALLPEYLRKWPYLRALPDLDAYVAASRAADQRYTVRKGYVTEAAARRDARGEFFRTLRASLGQ